jgi:CubicO group peptidase (beta-lactamase class C family)
MRHDRHRRSLARWFALLALALLWWRGEARAQTAAAPAACAARYAFGRDEPERHGIDPQRLLELTNWIRTSPYAVLSLIISRDGKIVYELYSSRVDRDDAHYLMSVTKSVTAALVGAAIDRHLLKAPTGTVTDNLPSAVFPDGTAMQRFRSVSLKDLLGMSALDAQVAPHLETAEAIDRGRRFSRSANRLRFALEQPTLPRPGIDFQYTDITPIIAGGIVQYATHQSLFDFAKAALFDPMGFQNEEWMHQDKAGFDNAAYGLRLRPVDMQKFGLLFMNQGCWEGRRLLSEKWVATSFTPWIKTRPDNRYDNYGWYWWTDHFASGWIGHTANGSKGQRITIVPDRRIVVSMTAIENGNEAKLVREVFERFVIPAVDAKPAPDAAVAATKAQLKAALAQVWTQKTALKPNTEARMVPSAKPKEAHQPFRD